MTKLENDCRGCPPELGCAGPDCPYRRAPHHYCDLCGDETDLYHFDDSELCLDCIRHTLKPVV